MTERRTKFGIGMAPMTKSIIALALIASAIGVTGFACALRHGEREGDARATEAREERDVEEAPAPPETHDAAPALSSAPPPAAVAPAPSRDRAAAMRDALAWTDDAARIDAIEAAAAEGATETLGVLESVDLARDPEAAPAVIHALGVLGARARGDDAAQATATLRRWLHEETQREGADARGNVSLAVEALGAIGDRDAAQALAATLDDGVLPLHVQTLAVQELTSIGDRSAASAVARFAERVSQLAPQPEGLDEELRREALAAAAAATDRLGR